MSKCSVVLDWNCAAPANGPGSVRTKCYECGEPVCLSCSQKRERRGREVRICDNCEPLDRFPYGAADSIGVDFGRRELIALDKFIVDALDGKPIDHSRYEDLRSALGKLQGANRKLNGTAASIAKATVKAGSGR